MPNDKPMIFSAPMVRALLDGRKTMTRQILRNVPQPPDDTIHPAYVDRPVREKPYVDSYCSQPHTRLNPRGVSNVWCWWTRDNRCGASFKVNFVPGMRLWVRETFADVNSGYGPGIGYKADGDFYQPEYDGPDEGAGPSYNYDKYPGDYTMWYSDLLSGSPGHKWRSPIHMPRWASRITLIVTGVTVERLNDISEADAWAEGVSYLSHGTTRSESEGRALYAMLWDSIHGDGAWALNPWVAAISFNVEKRNIDEVASNAA